MQTTSSVADNAKSLEKAKLLWEEYKYRHDLMWGLAFQITAAFVALSVAPYLNQGIVEGLGIWIVTVPGLALVLVVVAIPMMWNERKLFRQVRDKYWPMERELFGIGDERAFSGIRGRFLHSNFAIFYLIILAVLALINLVNAIKLYT